MISGHFNAFVAEHAHLLQADLPKSELDSKRRAENVNGFRGEPVKPGCIQKLISEIVLRTVYQQHHIQKS